MLEWLKKLKAIVAAYDSDFHHMVVRMAELEKLVRERTNIAVDVGFKSAHHVIVVGRYKNADYVQTFSLHEHDMVPLIDQLRDMARHGKIQRVDAPPIFRAVFERDRGGYDF